MKTRFTLVLMALFVAFSIGAQQDEESMNNLSIFSSYVKNKKYDEAYDTWMKVRTKSPKFNRNIYVGGEKILEHKIKNSSGSEKLAFVKDLLTLYSQYNEHYASKFPTGKMLAEQGQLSYTYKKELGLSDEDVYKIFDDAYNKDLKNFTSPKGLYTYFSLMVDLYDDGKKQAQELFDKYDDVNDKIETEVSKYSELKNKLVEKEEAGTALTAKETKRKSSYESYLDAYDKISGSIDTKLGKRANCEVLIPLYQKDFEENKDNTVWLQRAMNRMYTKDCTDDPMFIKIVQQKNAIDPTADAAYYIGFLLSKEGKNSEAEKYFKQAINLETDNLKKAKITKRLGEKYYKKGNYGKARQYYRQALKLNPSDGSPYLRIAAMYAKSAPNCGTDNFNKRAVFWLAALEAEKAGRVDSRLRKSAAEYAANYRAKAPSRSEIFSKGNAGEKISIGCWIGGTVTVPKL